MPSWSVNAACIDLMLCNEDELMEYGAWTAMTQEEALPYREEGKAIWDAKERAAVLSFKATLLEKSEKERLKFLRPTVDNFAEGRQLLKEYLTKRVDVVWRIKARILECLETNQRGPYDIIRAMHANELPAVEDANLSKVHDELVLAIFGEGGTLWGEGRMPKSWAVEFIRRMYYIIWHREKRRIAREIKRLKTQAKQLDADWAGVLKNKTLKSLETWKKTLADRRSTAQKFGGTELAKSFEEHTVKATNVIEAILMNREDEECHVLPKSLLDALRLLAGDADAKRFAVELQELVQEEGDVVEESVPMDSEGFDPSQWGTGVEQYEQMTEDQLWQALGRGAEKTVPFFNTEQFVTGAYDPWTEEGVERLARGTGLAPLAPMQHQLLGIYAMLEHTFAGRPTLLMDGVGVGKTMQVVGFVCFVTWFHEFFAKNKHFPGVFNGRKYKDANLPNLPHLIVVPLALERQFVSEIHRYVKRHTFDLFSYTTATRGRFATAFFAEVDKRKTKQIFQIFVATLPGINKDADALFKANTTNAWLPGVPRFARQAQEVKRAKTIFRQHYGTLSIDEIHVNRRPSIQYRALRTLRDQAEVVIGMTATPVITSPMDLMAIGRLIGAPAFGPDHDERMDDHRKALNTAAARDRRERAKAAKEIDEPSALHARQMDTLRTTELLKETAKVMAEFRTRWTGMIIRRTVNTKRPDGSPISGLPPMHEKFIMLRLSEEEKKWMDVAAETTSEGTAGVRNAATDKAFYIALRRTMFHPSTTQWSTFPVPEKLEDFEENPTAKLQALVRIIKHHVSTPRAKPLMNVPELAGKSLEELPPFPEANELVEDEAFEYAKYEGDGPDKIIVFSYFPSNEHILHSLFREYGVKAVFLNGTLSPAMRAEIVELFKTCGPDGPTVLVMSSVGATGLNLAWANIMIFVDNTWSAQEDQQAIGRILRYGQERDVLIYRLIALGSADIILNNIAFSKGMMHQAFVDSSFALKKALDALISTKVAGMIDPESIRKEELAPMNAENEETEDEEDEIEQTPAKKPRGGKKKVVSSAAVIDVDEDEAGPSNAAAAATTDKEKQRRQEEIAKDCEKGAQRARKAQAAKDKAVKAAEAKAAKAAKAAEAKAAKAAKTAASSSSTAKPKPKPAYKGKSTAPADENAQAKETAPASKNSPPVPGAETALPNLTSAVPDQQQHAPPPPQSPAPPAAKSPAPPQPESLAPAQRMHLEREEGEHEQPDGDVRMNHEESPPIAPRVTTPTDETMNTAEGVRPLTADEAQETRSALPDVEMHGEHGPTTPPQFFTGQPETSLFWPRPGPSPTRIGPRPTVDDILNSLHSTGINPRLLTRATSPPGPDDVSTATRSDNGAAASTSNAGVVPPARPSLSPLGDRTESTEPSSPLSTPEPSDDEVEQEPPPRTTRSGGKRKRQEPRSLPKAPPRRKARQPSPPHSPEAGPSTGGASEGVPVERLTRSVAGGKRPRARFSKRGKK